MSTYSAQLDLQAALALPRRCPGCSATGLQASVESGQAVFGCPACGHRWRIELARASRIDLPRTP